MFSGLQPNSRLVLAWAISLLPMACADGCKRSSEPSGPTSETASTRDPPGAVAPVGPHGAGGDSAAVAAGIELGAVDAGLAGASWAGPFFTVTSSSAGVYLEPSTQRALKIGFARSGGRLAVLPEKVSGDACRVGWYQLVGGGYICGSAGTIDPEDPLARLSVQAPDLSAILPYPYARNAHNGTPLYSSVPSRDQMATYEPYLETARPAARDPGEPPLVADAGSRPWWQRDEAQISEVRLAQLATESDGVIARRMVKGFYIAIDKEFEWSSRTWYKTTKGMVAPKDRFVAVEGSDFKGVELTEGQALPVAWAYGFRQQRPRYHLSEENRVKQVGVFGRLEPVYVTDGAIDADGHQYLQSRDGFLIRTDHVRVARAPAIPASVTADERWIHVDLRSQVLVALVGSRPVYATLISSGKESEDATKDHRTPTGEWTIREKHVTTTMDGDGTAAGDLPYSIEDVPYVMYFEGSYALHGAFWHRNYGVRMSHGCINLAPLDAKHLFLFTGPVVRDGWHGAWSGNGQGGSRIVIDGPARGTPAGP